MLLRQTLLYLPAQLVGPFALFVAAVVWTHILPPGDYGTLMLIMAMQELIFGFGLSGLSLTVLRYRDALETGEGAERFRRSEAFMLYGSMAAQALAVWILLPFVGRATPELLAVAAFFIVSRSLLAHFAERMRAVGEVFWYTAAQTAGPVIGFSFAIILTRLIEATPTVALAGYAAAQLLVLPFAWRMSGASFAASWPGRDFLAPLTRYGLPLLLSSFVTWLSINGIRFVVDVMQGAVALGLMSVGWGLGQRIASTVSMLVTAAAFPLAVKSFNQGDRAGAMDQLAQNGVWLAALLAPATAGLILIDDQFVKLFVGQPYWAATIAILPLAVLSGVVRNFRMHYADQVYLLHEKTGWLLAITVAEAAATLIGAGVGLVVHGLVGAVIGALIAHVAAAIFTFAQAAIMLGLRFRWNEMARVALATAAMSVAVFHAPAGATVAQMAAAIAAGAAVYGIAILLLFPEFFRKLRPALAG